MPSRASWMMLRGLGTRPARLAAFGVSAAHAGPRVDATVIAISDGDTLWAELAEAAGAVFAARRRCGSSGSTARRPTRSRGGRVLICDRDSKWTDGFRRIVQGAGVRIVLTPVQAPNANAYAERFVRSIREECLDRLILFGRRRLLRALNEFVAHYHGKRNHQGLGNELITPETCPLRATHVRCRQRLGGLLRYYHRTA
jgi:transposase InsO family protein